LGLIIEVKDGAYLPTMWTGFRYTWAIKSTSVDST